MTAQVTASAKALCGMGLATSGKSKEARVAGAERQGKYSPGHGVRGHGGQITWGSRAILRTPAFL